MAGTPDNKAKMESKDHCGLCGNPLVYGTEEILRQCVYCGKETPSPICCPEGHYICDSCHRAQALDTLGYVLDSSSSTCPMVILELVMSHPSIPMHGPEHHAMVPAVILAAVRNAGYSLPEGALETAIIRGSKVPGGWCGSHGACGSAIGAGIAVSVLTEATPLKGKQRTLANEATQLALSRMLNEHPRCCKKAARIAVETIVDFLRDKLDIKLDSGDSPRCRYSERNRECVRGKCPYYPSG